MQQTKEYNVSNCQLEGAQFLHLACQGGRSLPCPLPVTSLSVVT